MVACTFATAFECCLGCWRLFIVVVVAAADKNWPNVGTAGVVGIAAAAAVVAVLFAAEPRHTSHQIQHSCLAAVVPTPRGFWRLLAVVVVAACSATGHQSLYTFAVAYIFAAAFQCCWDCW